MLTDEFSALAGHMWRRRTLVLLVTLLFGAAGWYSTHGDETVYTSSAALTVTSGNHSPDQDAVLSQGYAAFFNDGLYQQKLRKQADVPDDVGFEATTGLASPLLYVTASSTNPDHVATAARAMADALRNEVNLAIYGTQQQEIADLRAAFEELRATTDEVPEQAVVDLQQQINEITTDSSSKLQPVQLNSYVQETSADTTTMLLLGLGGGLFVGCALAVLLGVTSRRVETATQAERATGLELVAEVGPEPDVVTDTQLWTVVRAEQDAHGALLRDTRTGDDGATVVAVTSPRQHGASGGVARRLAHAASRTGKTLLIDLSGSADAGRGLTDYVRDESVTTSQVVRKVHATLATLGPGAAEADLYAALNDPRGVELLGHLRRGFSTIVLASPSTLDSAEALASCGLADAVVLVVEQGRSRTGDVSQSVQLLGAVVTAPLQLVLVQRRRSRRRTDGRGASGDGRVETSVEAKLSRVP